MSVMTIVACSNSNNDSGNNNNNNQPSSSAFQTTIDQFFTEQKLSFNFKKPVITEALFVQNQNNLAELKKAFALENKTDQSFNFDLVKAEIVDQRVIINIKITNQAQEQAFRTIELVKSFTADQQSYVNQVYNEIGKNLRLKPEFTNQKLTQLLAKIQSHDEITNWIIQEEFLGIKVKFIIPSQTINATSGFNVNYLLYDENDKPQNPNGSSADLGRKYLQLDSELITPLTLLFEKDLNGQELSLNDFDQYFGQVFLLRDEKNSKNQANLTINTAFNGKHITGKLDFRNFNDITFASSADFSGNEITDLIFNEQTKIENLKSGLFTTNKLNQVILPATVTEFNIGAFDATTQILGLEKQSFIQQFYDPTNKDLFLNRLNSQEEIDKAFQYLQKIQGNQTVTLNKVYLPNLEFNYNGVVAAEEIIFNSASSSNKEILKTKSFTTNLSNWQVSKPIIISENIFLIDKKLLPANAVIQRKFNQTILNLIQNDKSLSLDQEVAQLSADGNKFILFENLDKLDQLFNPFSSDETKIKSLKTIIIKRKELTGNSILSNNDLFKLRQSLDFFKDNSAADKELKISSQFKTIAYDDFANLKNELKLKSITITREKPNDFDFINLDNGELDLAKFYNNSITNGSADLYRFLLGFEDKIKTIKKDSTINKIKNGSFKLIEFSNPINLDLSNINEVEANAFYGTKNLNLTWPTTAVLTKVGDNAFYQTKANLSNTTLSKATEIGSWAFYSSTNNDQLTSLDLSAATKIGQSAFSNTNLQDIQLSSKLNIIESFAFSNANLTSLTIPNSVTQINDYAFANNKIISSNLNLTSVNLIGNSAFYNAGEIDNVQLSNGLQTISNSAFSNIKLKQLSIPISVTLIDDSAFSNNLIESNLLDLANVAKIGNSAFNGAGKISSVNLNKVQEIGANAFYNAGLKTLTLPSSLRLVGSGAFASNANLTTVNGIDFEQLNLVNAFGPINNQTNIDFKPPNNYKTMIGFDETNKKLDLTKTNTLSSVKLNNFLALLLKTETQFNEIILPDTVDQNLINLLTSGTTIKKLSWHKAGKVMNFSLNGKTNIESLSEDFVQGMEQIPENAFSGMNMTGMKTVNFSLNSVTKVGAFAFKNSGIKMFKDTTNLKEIASQAFDYDTTITLEADVKLKDDSFSAPTGEVLKLPTTVSRSKIFSQNSKYWEIYNQETKVLDFTKAKISDQKFFSKNDWSEYLNIGHYLLDGDVKEIILPKIYVIWDEFVNDLGNVNKITFQTLNQQIYVDAFNGTTVQNKPEQNQTNIIYDGDNFFAK